MTLQNPWWLLLALLVPLALWLGWRRGGPTVLFAPGAFLARLPGGWRVRLLPLPWLLLAAGLRDVDASQCQMAGRPVIRVAARGPAPAASSC